MSSVSPSPTRKDAAPSPGRPILAGGAVVTRDDELRGTEVLVIHRKRYDDWTLPKGKLEVGRVHSRLCGAGGAGGDRRHNPAQRAAGFHQLRGRATPD